MPISINTDANDLRHDIFGRLIRGFLFCGCIGLTLPNVACRTPGPVGTVNTISTVAAVPLSITGKPRLRMGRSPTGAVIGPNIGKHGYKPNFSERNGIVFTCRAGQIDTAHTRKTADWTYYLAKTFRMHLENNETTFSYKMPEPSRYFVGLVYPDNWQTLAPEERDAITRDVAIELGAYAAYIGTTWHEMLTWEGYRASKIMPEFFSAFSWEENFSNLLGSHVAAKALRDEDRTYSAALTRALDEELAILGAQPANVASKARRQVKGEWFSGTILNINIKRRNFDIGLDDGFVTPTVFPVSECEGIDPMDYPIPNLDAIREYGFEITFELEPVIKEQLVRCVYPDESVKGRRINPERHFGVIMEHIRQEGIALYGPDCDSHTL